MNDGSTNAKQQIVDRIKNTSNILVTVSTNPSVDELSAALGLTILLNNLDKHATAVVSGEVPPAITFLDPAKTFENTVDSLRDFIIALNKEKADHLRYKVDGDVVKIFITPYRTTITQEDLDFSQGDYNVELVLALGVRNKDHLDKALESHGRILHDATVATITCGDDKSELGSIDWFESGASSVSEMLVSLSEALKGDKDKPLLDEQIATAFLTGIVAATDRFSNNKTSSKVMTMAAQLMAAGANQQLIAAKLEEGGEVSAPEAPAGNGNDEPPASSPNSDGTTNLTEGKSTKVKKQQAETAKESEADGSLQIRPSGPTLEELDAQAKASPEPDAEKQAEDSLEQQLQAVASPAAANVPSVSDLQKDLANASADVDKAAAKAPAAEEEKEPTLGGTLNATTEQAAIDKRREEADSRNRTILTHGGSSLGATDGPVLVQAPFSAATDTSAPKEDSQPAEPPKAASAPPAPEPPVESAKPDYIETPVAGPVASVGETLADIESKNRGAKHEDARAAVAAAYDAAPFDPANHPRESAGAAELGEPSHEMPTSAPPAPQGLPPLPDFSTLPPPPPPIDFAPIGPAPVAPLEPSPTPPSAPTSADPGQFRIPGQS